MAFAYETGTADDLPDWFSKFETFLATIGWTVVSGSGTTDLVISSGGEQGGLTKLFARYRRDTGANAYKVYYSVQDDAAGTHKTTDYEPAQAEGLGDVPFVYLMNGDKDMICINFKRGAGYTGGYAGLVEQFAQGIADETYLMAIYAMHMDGHIGATCGYMLRRYDGLWNQTARRYGPHTYVKDPLDDSVALFGCVSLTNAYDDIKGQLKNVAGQIYSMPALNPEDTLTTGLPGATSTWIVLGTATERWGIRTGGVLPLGTADGAHFTHQAALASSIGNLFSKIGTFLTGVGWTISDTSGSSYTYDKIAYSQGEEGGEDIYIRYYYDDVRSLIFTVRDDATGTHKVSAGYVGGTEGPLTDGNFPTYYYITADRNCLHFTLNKNGVYQTIWAGMFKVLNPNAAALDTPYKVGGFGTPGTANKILRSHDGTWEGNTTGWTAPEYPWSNSSPNEYGDGDTYIVWAKAVKQTNYPADCPVGVMPYTYFLSGVISTLDTVQVGTQVFRYFADHTAMRIM